MQDAGGAVRRSFNVEKAIPHPKSGDIFRWTEPALTNYTYFLWLLAWKCMS